MSHDPHAVVKRVIELHGGRQAMLDAVQKSIDEFDAIWIQDIDRIGRVLRAHLAVEHFVTKFLAFKNPNLGALDKARLSYAQKLDLLDSKDRTIEFLLPGLRLLGAVRNRIAHRLRVELTKKDENDFLAIDMFRAMRDATSEHQPPTPVTDEVDSALIVLEGFSKFAAGLLQATLSPNQHIWAQAFAELGPDSFIDTQNV